MRLRYTLIILGFVGLVFLVATNVGGIGKFIDAVGDVKWYVVPVVIALQTLGYYANAKYYQVFFAASGRQVNLRRLFEASVGINFVNQALPAGGIAGTGYLAEVVKPDVPGGTATLAQLGRYVFTFLSYFAVLALGFVVLALSGDLNKPSVRVMILVMVLILLIGVLVVPIVADRRRLEKFVRPVVRFVNGFGKSVLRRRANLITLVRFDEFMTDFARDYEIVSRDKRSRAMMLAWTLVGNLTELATVYAVFIGFGLWPNVGVVITGYTLAVMVSVLGLATGGVGVYEFGMIGTLTALGVPLATSFAVVIVYRGLSMIFFLPPGFYYYHRHLKEAH